MPVGMSKGYAVTHLTAWKAAYPYVQKHIGDPGVAGTANIAVDTPRVAVDWATPIDTTPGVVTLTHTDDLDWSTVAASERYTHVTHWSASTAGTFGGSGEVTADPVAVGNDWSLPAGSLIVTQPVASNPGA